MANTRHARPPATNNRRATTGIALSRERARHRTHATISDVHATAGAR